MAGQVGVINLVLNELTLVSWYWVLRKDPSDMLSHPIINARLFLD